MKKIFKFSILFGFYSMLFGFCYAQWQQPDIRLTNAAGFSTNSDLASSGNYLHAVWQDTRATGSEVFYKRSTNQGINWDADFQLTNSTGSIQLPSVSAADNIVHVVWNDNRDGNPEIYYKRSTNNGINWESDVRLTNDPAVSSEAVISAEGQLVNVIWRDTRDGSHEIFYKRSTDGGATWSTDTMLTNHSAGLAASISMSVSGLNVHLAWSDTRDNNDYEIYYKRSTNGGISWGADTRLTNELRISESPAITLNSSEIHITWVDLRDSNINTEIYYKRSTDNGNSWSSDTRLTVYANAMNPSILLSGPIVHLAWHNSSGSEINYRRSLNSGVTWETKEQVSSSFSGAIQPNIAVTGNKVHIIWHDVRNGSTNSEIYYDYNPSGNSIGIQNISTEIPDNFTLSQNYPNPFNPVTNIRFQVKQSIEVKLIIYDVNGREAGTIVNQKLQAGTYEAEWDGSRHSSGVYFYKVIAGEFIETKRMVLVK